MNFFETTTIKSFEIVNKSLKIACESRKSQQNLFSTFLFTRKKIIIHSRNTPDREKKQTLGRHNLENQFT